MGRYFGTDGVRGQANTELTAELAFRLGLAAAGVLATEEQRPLLLIGKDTRVSGDMLEAALAAGAAAAGCDVLLLGVLPTPGVAVLTRQLGASAGAVISASHNPYDDNGIKFFSADGFKLPDAIEERMEELIATVDSLVLPAGDGVGRIRCCRDAAERYCSWLHSRLSPDLRGLKLVVDAANGAAAPIAAQVFSRLGAEVVMIADQPDGRNINRDCGSTHLAGLRRKVVKTGADLGLAFDGDADRLLAVDEAGREVDGDQIIAVFTRHLRAAGQLRHNCVAITVMSNLGLRQALEGMEVAVEETVVGDRYVMERMLQKDLCLGGESSGHIILRDHSTTGDGLLAALLLLSILRAEGQTLSQLAAVMTRLPQILINVRVRTKVGWQDNAAIAAAAAEAEARLAAGGRLLLRASGTEPLLRVMAEGRDQQELQEIAGALAQVIHDQLG